MGECLPRRVPPDSRTRLATIADKHTPGSGNGDSRNKQPVPTIPDINFAPGPIGPHQLGTFVQFWYNPFTVLRTSSGAAFGSHQEVHHLTWLPLLYSEHVYLDGVEQQEGETWRRIEQDILVLGSMERRAGQLLEVRYAYDGRQPGGEIHTLPPIADGGFPGSANKWTVFRIVGIFPYTVQGNQAAFDCCFDHVNHGDHNFGELWWSVASHSCTPVPRGDGWDTDLQPFGIVGDTARMSDLADPAPEAEVYAHQAINSPRAFLFARYTAEWFTRSGVTLPAGDILWETAPFSNDFRYWPDYPDGQYDAADPDLVTVPGRGWGPPSATLVQATVQLLGTTPDFVPDELVTAGFYQVDADDRGAVFGTGDDITTPADTWADPEDIGPAHRLFTFDSAGGGALTTSTIDTTTFVFEPPDQPYPVLLQISDNALNEDPPDALTGSPFEPAGHSRKFSFVYRWDYVMQPPRYKVVTPP